MVGTLSSTLAQTLAAALLAAVAVLLHLIEQAGFGSLINRLDCSCPLFQPLVSRMLLFQFVYIPQQVYPTSLVQPRMRVIPAIEITHYYPFILIA